MRSRSVLVRPNLRPWSVSAQRTHLHSISGVMPSWAAIEVIAAHWEGCSRSRSETRRTPAP